jgi:hypothetical protein
MAFFTEFAYLCLILTLRQLEDGTLSRYGLLLPARQLKQLEKQLEATRWSYSK